MLKAGEKKRKEKKILPLLPRALREKEIASLYPTRFLGSSEQESVVERSETKIRENKRELLIFSSPGLGSPTQHLTHTAF